MAGAETYERPAIAGSGTIATGLAACASVASKVSCWPAPTPRPGEAEEQAHSLSAKVDGGDAKRIKVTTETGDLADCDLVVEAVVEELGPKADLLKAVGDAAADADLATTTSSLSLDELGSAEWPCRARLRAAPLQPGGRRWS